jgi:hypothetical protein
VREFVVTLNNGMRYTVKADHVRREPNYLALVLAQPSTIGDLDPFESVVALFDTRQVAVVVARDHLVSEEKGQPVDPHFVAGDDPDSDIPF